MNNNFANGPGTFFLKACMVTVLLFVLPCYAKKDMEVILPLDTIDKYASYDVLLQHSGIKKMISNFNAEASKFYIYYGGSSRSFRAAKRLRDQLIATGVSSSAVILRPYLKSGNHINLTMENK